MVNVKTKTEVIGTVESLIHVYLFNNINHMKTGHNKK
jgi:hypothetical protein